MEVLGYLNFFYMKLTVAIENFDVAIWKVDALNAG